MSVLLIKKAKYELLKKGLKNCSPLSPTGLAIPHVDYSVFSLFRRDLSGLRFVDLFSGLAT
jgi:hypothetical protein